MPDEKIPRRLFIKKSAMAASAMAITLTTDARAKSMPQQFLTGGDPGHPYLYMEEP